MGAHPAIPVKLTLLLLAVIAPAFAGAGSRPSVLDLALDLRLIDGNELLDLPKLRHETSPPN